MKKIISSVVAMFLAIILLSNVSAVEVSTDTIAAGSYLIGTHLFDREGSSSYDGTLTVKHIMFASKTIIGNSLEDMQILYKRARDGAWLDAITNEVVEMPEKVNIVHRNLEQMLVAPTLLKASGGLGYANVSIISIGAYAPEEMWDTIAGYEIYEKNGEELVLIGKFETDKSVKLTVKAGERKVFVARVFAYNDKIQTIYSDYSNEIILELPLEAPTLATGLGSMNGTRDLSIIEAGTYGYEEMWNAIDGYELYEKDGEKHILIDEYEPTDVAMVTVDVGESKTFVAKVFVYNSQNEKVYSDYSNEYVWTYELETPTLAPGGWNGAGTAYIAIIEDGAYGYEDMWNSIDGYELYEKAGEEYILMDEYEPTDVAIVTADVGERNVYVARVFKYNKSNEKVYSDYSNEYVLENIAAYINYGDVNEDGKIDIADALLVLSYVVENTTLTDTQLLKADVNGDGYVDKVDAHLLTGFDAGYFPNTLPNTQITDYILYGDVLNSGDLYELESPVAYSAIEQYLNGNTSYLEGQALKNADVNGDGEVNHIDKCIIYGYINGLIDGIVLPSLTPVVNYTLYGDIDNNGIVDSDDAYLLENYLMDYDTLCVQGLKNADMNGDGVVNDDDYPILIQYLLDGNGLPFYEPKGTITKVEYYIFNELEANEYLISVPQEVEIEWNGEYQFGDNSVIYDIELFELPSEFNEWERFEGWFLDEEGVTEFDETQTLTGITKLYAKFDTEFIMVYNGNGATGGTMENSVFNIGETVKLAKNVYTRDGYKFVAWSNDAEDFSELANDEEEFEIPLWFLTEAKEPFTLYAVWEKETVLGDVHEDGEINGTDATKILRHIMELEELTEYQLVVADVNLDGEVDYVDYQIILKKAAGLIESLPYDSGEKYTISYDLDGGSGELAIELFPTEYAEVSLPMRLPTLVKDGYVFKGWTGSNGDVPQTEVTITEGATGDLEYTANWELAE